LKLEQLGRFSEIRKSLNVNTDRKRKWPRDYKNFNDLLTSEPQISQPYFISEITKAALMREIADVQRSEREDLKRARMYMRTDLYEPDRTLEHYEQIEEAKKEMMRFII